MLITTTSVIEGAKITRYYGIVSGETIIGANVFRDFFASIRDVVGGRSGSYEEVLREAKDTALREMQEQARLLGANAVIGVDLDYETVGGSGSMLMVTACGTAVTVEYRECGKIKNACGLFLSGTELYRIHGLTLFFSVKSCVIPRLKEIIKYVLIYSFVFPVFGINSVNRLLISFQINTFKLSFNLLIRFMLWTNCFSGWYRPLPFWRFALPGISIVR